MIISLFLTNFLSSHRFWLSYCPPFIPCYSYSSSLFCVIPRPVPQENCPLAKTITVKGINPSLGFFTLKESVLCGKTLGVLLWVSSTKKEKMCTSPWQKNNIMANWPQCKFIDWEIKWWLYEKEDVRWWPATTLPMQISIRCRPKLLMDVAFLWKAEGVNMADHLNAFLCLR